MDAAGIFAMDVGAIDWADGLVAIMDGPDPDAGTSWEVGYAYGSRKPIVLVRTDFRELAGEAGRYNPLLAESATIRLYLPMASTTEVITAIREALSMIERDRLGKGATPA
jgi:nucleoside 2-deoxyribosyltransferase